MSFFDDASLAFLPSGAAGKDGKAYSIKPTDGSGDFTFSRGSNLTATRVGADGLIEKGRENLLLQSNQFDTTWTTANASVTSGQSGYDGSSDAWLVDISAGTNSQHIRQSATASGVTSYSIYAKANTLDWILLYVDAPQVTRGYFDIANGVLGGANNLIDSKIESVGNGYYRCTIVYSDSITQVRLYLASGDGNITQSSGSVYIQDAQLEIGLAATDYIESGATTGKAGLLEDEPRFDYSGGATCPSLLLEPSRTQLYGYSEYSGIWSKTNWTTTDNYAISPEGVKNAFRAVSSSTGGIMRIGGTGTTGQDNTLSVWAKSNTGSDQKFRFFGNGNTITSSDFTATTEWQRFDYTYACTFVTAGIKGASSELSDILFYGFQHEAGSYPTSYIPNHSGGSVTRGADLCVDAGDVNTFNSAEGVLYFEVAGFENDLSDRYISISDGTSNNAIRVFYYQDSGTTFFRKNVNGVQTTIFSTGDINKSELNKIAIKYNSTNFDIFSNGVKLSTNLDSNSFPINTLSEVNFANADGVANSFNGKVNQLLTFNTALSDADCITLTTL